MKQYFMGVSAFLTVAFAPVVAHSLHANVGGAYATLGPFMLFVFFGVMVGLVVLCRRLLDRMRKQHTRQNNHS